MESESLFRTHTLQTHCKIWLADVFPLWVVDYAEQKRQREGERE